MLLIFSSLWVTNMTYSMFSSSLKAILSTTANVNMQTMTATPKTGDQPFVEKHLTVDKYR